MCSALFAKKARKRQDIFCSARWANGASGVYHPAVAFPHGTAMRRTLHSVKLGELGGMEAHNAANKLLCPKQTFAFFRVT
jgi:hypothetical protein